MTDMIVLLQAGFPFLNYFITLKAVFRDRGSVEVLVMFVEASEMGFRARLTANYPRHECSRQKR